MISNFWRHTGFFYSYNAPVENPDEESGRVQELVTSFNEVLPDQMRVSLEIQKLRGAKVMENYFSSFDPFRSVDTSPQIKVN